MKDKDRLAVAFPDKLRRGAPLPFMISFEALRLLRVGRTELRARACVLLRNKMPIKQRIDPIEWPSLEELWMINEQASDEGAEALARALEAPARTTELLMRGMGPRRSRGQRHEL